MYIKDTHENKFILQGIHTYNLQRLAQKYNIYTIFKWIVKSYPNRTMEYTTYVHICLNINLFNFEHFNFFFLNLIY